jgi:hypothetical protein
MDDELVANGVTVAREQVTPAPVPQPRGGLGGADDVGVGDEPRHENQVKRLRLAVHLEGDVGAIR